MCFGIWNAKKFYVQANSFMHLLIFSAKWPWNWKAFQMNSEKDESWHGIIISPTYHVQKSREGYRKNWMHFVYKMNNLFEVSKFHRETCLLQRNFIFLNLFELPCFSVLKMHHSKPHHHFTTLSHFICYFSCIYWFFQLNDPEIEKHF